MTVRIGKVKDALEASVIEGNGWLDAEVDHVYASDLMSDVLAFGKPNSILLTGLASQQAISLRPHGGVQGGCADSRQEIQGWLSSFRP